MADNNVFRGDPINWIGAGYYRNVLVSRNPRRYAWVPISADAYNDLLDDGAYVTYVSALS